MSVTHITATPASFATSLATATAKATAASAPLFIHVRADFCSDCTSTDVTVSSAFSALDSAAVVLTALVDDSAAYSKPDFAYRTDEALKVKGIPTLIKVGAGRLEDADCGDPAKVAEFVGVDQGKVTPGTRHQAAA